MTKEEKIANFISNLKEIGFNFTDEFTEEKLAAAPAGCNSDSGNAYPGGLIDHVELTFAIAKRMTNMISGTFQISEESLKKAIYIQHLAKALMFEVNDNSWEIEKRGLLYKFANLDGVLKCGERSALIALNNGVKISPLEFEAIRSLDKDGEEAKSQKYLNDILTTVVRQANELAYMIERKKNIKK